MSQLNKQTVDAVEDILSFHATPVSIANGVQSATQGEVIDSGLAAANAVQSFGAIMSKTLGNLVPPLLAANLANDGFHMLRDAKSEELGGKYSDATLTSAAANVIAALTWLGTGAAAAALGPATAIALAAVGITTAAAFGVAALSQDKTSTAHHDWINQMLGKAMDLTASIGGGIGDFFSRQANSLETGISDFFDSISSGFLSASLNLGNQINSIESTVASLFNATHAYTPANVPTTVWEPRRYDPLTLDLDGDGIETHGIDPAQPIYLTIPALASPRPAAGWRPMTVFWCSTATATAGSTTARSCSATPPRSLLEARRSTVSTPCSRKTPTRTAG